MLVAQGRHDAVMAESAPDFTEQQLLAMYDRIDVKITHIEVNLGNKYGGPIEQASRLEEAKRLRAEVIVRLGYQPKSTLDKDLEDLKAKIDSGEPIRDDFSIGLGAVGDPIFKGPRGGRYRINNNGRKSYDVP